MSTTSLPRAVMVAALSFLAAAALALGPARLVDASEPVVPVAAAPDLHWGFKATWRNYAHDPEVGDGATEVAPTGGAMGYDLEWAFDSGSYDPEVKATHLEYSGTVRWKAHKASADGLSPPPGYSGEPDPYILDVTFRDPQITISRDESSITVEVKSRDANTWQMIDYGRVPLVNLDVLGVTPTVATGTTTWSSLTATVTELGHEAMAGFYRVGQVVDPVSFSYQGPGGAPDLAEHWDTPGAAMLKQVDNELFYDDTQVASFAPIWVDRENMIVYTLRNVTINGVASREVRAFSLAEMRQLGQPLVGPRTELPESVSTVGALESSHDRLLYRSFGDSGMKRWLRFNRTTGHYETGVFADPQMADNSFFGTGNAPFISWDRARDRGYRIQRIVPPGVPSSDFDNHEWQLMVFEEGTSGIWSKRVFRLPGFPAGQNQTGYASTTSTAPRLAVASDGSLIALAATRSNLAATAQIHGVYRVVFNQADDAIDVAPIPGLDVLNTLGTGGTFAFVQTGPDGRILLAQQGGEIIVQCQIGAGGAFACEDPVSVTDNVEGAPYEESRFAVDPIDGTIWFGALTSQKVAAFKGGAFRGAQFFKQRHPKGGPVLVGDDHFVYAQTNDGSPGESGGSKTWGFGKFERLGFVPTVTGQPADDAVSLGVGEPSEDVTFSSTATGDPAPARQWQVKAPGALKFTDLGGETGPTLTVAATRNLGGAEYRAVYSNAAGKVATDPATLGITYAPAVLQNPVNVTVAEGEEAEFALLSDGDPAPAVTWQRRVGGFWQAIDPGDENFEIEGHRLTVLETNTEQSGALFRAKLTNPLGSVNSKEAKLTVKPATSIPPGGLDLDQVSLDWSGSAELQKAPPFGGSNYFSAGSSDGDQASYRAVAGEAAIYQVSAGGEALASWPARAAHVGNGGSQLVRLYGGEGRVEPDGSVAIEWEGAFSVNFYGGLVPFTVTDPELVLDEDGDGVLTADLSGYASSQANPNQRTPLPPVADVTVATFSGAQVDPAEFTVVPDYAGVEVTVPVPFAPQNRSATGWGGWPQPFVDFHTQTGLAPYWYSSGGVADPLKGPQPLRVDLDGGEAPAETAPAGPGLVLPAAVGSGDPAAPSRPQLSVPRRAKLDGRGVAVVAEAICPGQVRCRLIVPHWVEVPIGGKRYWARVVAPPTLAPGGSVEIGLKLSKAARRALGDGSVKVRLEVTVRSSAGAVKRTIMVELGRAPGSGRPR